MSVYVCACVCARACIYTYIQGFFLYCCDESVMAFPANIQKRSAFYSMDNTTYKIGKAKATTGRAVIHNPPIGIQIYVCMYIRTYVCIYVYTACGNAYACEASFYEYVFMYVCMYVCMYVHTYTYVYTYI